VFSPLGVDEFKRAKIDVKTSIFFTILVTFVYVVPLQWHVNHGKLCLLNNMDIEKNQI
jgi:hypothetical protein